MAGLADVRLFLGEDWNEMEALLKEALLSEVTLLEETNMNILSHGGKMLRPMLSLLLARACSGGRTNRAAIHNAAASELLHNATLLHDDVVDGSDTRRGLPTLNALLGGSASVLVGDFWLVKALELIMSSGSNEQTGKDRVYSIFSSTLKDLAEGEMFQLQKALSGDTSEEDYYKIIYSKTASLFKAACLSAVVAMQAGEEMETAAAEYAVALGMAFQIKDDILDYSGDESIGKPIGEDLREQKITLPLLGALSKLTPQREREVRMMLGQIPQNPSNIETIMAIVAEYDGISYARKCLDSFVKKAKAALSVFPESEEKNFLIYLADYTAIRNL